MISKKPSIFEKFTQIADDAASTIYKKIEEKTLKTDITETEDVFEIKMDVPGVSKENIEVTFEDGDLTVTVNRGEETVEENQQIIKIERYTGTSSRTFFIGKEITDKDITVSCKDGVLTIIVKKPETVEETDTKVKITID